MDIHQRALNSLQVFYLRSIDGYEEQVTNGLQQVISLLTSLDDRVGDIEVNVDNLMSLEAKIDELKMLLEEVIDTENDLVRVSRGIRIPRLNSNDDDDDDD